MFWGGREGYENLWNTEMKRETDHIAKFFHMCADYAKEIGFEAQFLIEPKPKEPTLHQYDFDAATAIEFLRNHDLTDVFKLNLEGNHANLAGHTYQHEIRVARESGFLGSLDANQGDKLIGWDMDEFPTDLYETVAVMWEVLQAGSIGPHGGLNFDAKPRRTSFYEEDLFRSHIAGMDAYAAGLLVADKMNQTASSRIFRPSATAPTTPASARTSTRATSPWPTSKPTASTSRSPSSSPPPSPITSSPSRPPSTTTSLMPWLRSSDHRSDRLNSLHRACTHQL